MRVSVTWPRVLACLLLGVAMLSRPICWLYQSSQTTSINYPAELSSADGSLVVEYDRHSLNKFSADLHVIDYRRQHTITQHFTQDIQPLWLAGQSTVMLAQQRKQEHHVTLLRWALDTNTVAPFASFPTGSGEFSQMGSLSRDGHYGVILIHSMMSGSGWSDGYDIWKIDMQTRKLTLLKPVGSDWPFSISWQGDDALINCSTSILFVSMTTGQVTPRQLPKLWEGKS